jgi:hypothetical protein
VFPRTVVRLLFITTLQRTTVHVQTLSRGQNTITIKWSILPRGIYLFLYAFAMPLSAPFHIIQLGRVQKSNIHYTTTETPSKNMSRLLQPSIVTFLHPNLLPPTVTSRLSVRWPPIEGLPLYSLSVPFFISSLNAVNQPLPRSFLRVSIFCR